MYSGYGTTSPPLTNNPFISNAGQQASARFPDLSAAPGLDQQQQYGQQQQQQWGNGMSGGGYPQQQQQGNMYQQQQQPQQQQQMGYGQQPQQQPMNTGFMSPNPQPSSQYSVSTPGSVGGQFQPSSSFGQQLAAHVNGSSYGYLNGQQQQPTSTAYTPAQQQLQNPSYVAQFDPYSSLGQTGWASGNTPQTGGPGSGMGMQQQPQQQGYFSGAQQSTGQSTSSTTSTFSSNNNSNTGASYGLSASGDPHPKDFIRTHRASIEAWDQITWRQWISSFEALMRAWDLRKTELRQRAEGLVLQMNSIGGYDYQGIVPRIQQEAGRLQGLLKEAGDNHDSVAASLFQMKEVQEGYRQSSDLAGKRRVKEATNAALQGLPGWPQPF